MHPHGVDKMAKDFQALMSTGGIHVGIVGTGERMVAIAQTIRELIELRKFCIQMEEVAYIEYDKNKFAGNYITEEERIKYELPERKEKDDL